MVRDIICPRYPQEQVLGGLYQRRIEDAPEGFRAGDRIPGCCNPIVKLLELVRLQTHANERARLLRAFAFRVITT